MTIEVHEYARVAQRRLGFIAPTAAAGGDAPPITHRHPEPTPGQTVTWHPEPPPPRRFTAINLPAIPVVVSMTTVVLILTAHAIATVTGSRVDPVQVLLVVVALMIVSTVVAALILAGWRLVRLKSMTSRPVADVGIVDPWLVGWDDAGDDGSEIVVLGRHVIAQEDSAPLHLQGGPRPEGRRPEPVSPQREGLRPGAPPKAASRAALGNTENSLPFPADDPEAHQ